MLVPSVIHGYEIYSKVWSEQVEILISGRCGGDVIPTTLIAYYATRAEIDNGPTFRPDR